MTWLTLNVFNLRFPCRINQLVSGYECDMTFISDDTPTVNHTRREVASYQVGIFFIRTENITGTRLHSSQGEERDST